MAKKESREWTGCIGHIEGARDFARESFVYGLKGRYEYAMSPRKYDDATRQMEDWFSECIQTKTVKVRNKVKYLSLDCREHTRNPLYKIWKTCSFTTNELVFFFFIIDYLSGKNEAVRLNDIYVKYECFHRTGGFYKSAAQKWLTTKCCPHGIVIKEKTKYRLAPCTDLSGLSDVLDFYSEIAPIGVIGSFIMDRQKEKKSVFRYKQHFSGQAFDCEVLCNILYAIRKGMELHMVYFPRGREKFSTTVLPVKVYSSTQNGRQYLFAWNIQDEKYYTYRIDNIGDVEISHCRYSVVDIKEGFKEIQKHLWGVSYLEEKITHVELSVKIEEDEPYIYNRLIREKRGGTVTWTDTVLGIAKYEVDVFDAREMFPWLRTFICRIVELKISDKELEKDFWESVKDMYQMYSVEG